jgi:hypothetical protein
MSTQLIAAAADAYADVLSARATAYTDKLKSLPHVTASVRAAPNLWPENGVIIWAAPNVALMCHSNNTDLSKMTFTGYSPSEHHYCPTAKWDEWVTLARRIIAVDEAMRPPVTTRDERKEGI